MKNLKKIAIIGATVGAGVYFVQKCVLPKVSVFFAHEDDDASDDAEKGEKTEGEGCDGDCEHCCEIRQVPLSEVPSEVKAALRAIADAVNAEDAEKETEDEDEPEYDDDDLDVGDYGLTDEDFEDLDMLFESDNFEQPDGKFEEPYFTV